MLSGWLLSGLSPTKVRPVLTLHCAAVLKRPIEQIARRFEEQTGTLVRTQFGGSSALLSALRLAPKGDLYLAAEQSYVRQAVGFGLVESVWPVARIVPVIAVQRGNPRHIARLEDLMREDVRVALANPEVAAIGSVARRVLREAGLWQGVLTRARVLKPTVNDIAGDVALGVVDAAIVWDATVAQYDPLDAIRDTRLDAAESYAALGVLTRARHTDQARRFAHFLTESPQAVDALRRAGLEPVSGVGSPTTVAVP